MTFAIAVDDRFRLPRFGNALLQAIVGKVPICPGDLPQPLRPGCTKRPKGSVKSKQLKDS